MAEEKKHVIDTYSPTEFFAEVIGEFGAGHSAALVGWMFLFGATGGDNRPDMIARLIGAGFSKSAVYRAAHDILRLTERLYEKRGRLDELPDFAEAAADMARAARRVDLKDAPRPSLNY